MSILTRDEVSRAVRLALEEDIGSGDVTTLAVVGEKVNARGAMVARESLVVAGIELGEAAFLELSPGLQTERLLSDGETAARGTKLLRVNGSAGAILTAERV